MQRTQTLFLAAAALLLLVSMAATASPDTGEPIEQGFVRTQQTLAGGTIVDVGDSQYGGVGYFLVGYAVARPATPLMLMVTWKFMNVGLMGPDPGLKFFLTGLKALASPGADGWPMINSGAAVNPLRRANIRSGSLTLPVAETNTNRTGDYCPPVIVPDPKLDSFGVYFNTAGTIVCRATPIATTPVSVYIMLANPTTAIKGFELAYRIYGWTEGQVEDPVAEEISSFGSVKSLFR